MKPVHITRDVVQKVAKLANLTITPQQEVIFSKQLSSVLGYVSNPELNTDDIPETSQVTGSENVFEKIL